MPASLLKTHVRLLAGLTLGVTLVAGSIWALPIKEYKSGKVWPEPKVIDPGPPGGPPSDAIVLFDGKDLSAWQGASSWKVADGIATVVRRSHLN